MAYIKLFQELWRYAAGFRWKVVTFILLHALANLATLAQPLVFGQILNSFQKQSDQILNTIIMWLGVWVGLFVWFNLFHRAANYFCYDVSYRVKQAFLNDYYQTVTRLPLKWHTDHHSGSTINRINTAAEALFSFGINHYQYINFFMLFWGPLIALCLLSWQVSVMAFVVSVVSIFVMWLFDKKLVVLYHQMNEIQHKVASVFYDYVSNIKTIITLRLGPSTGIEFNHQIEKGYAPSMRSESQINQMKWLSISFGVLILEAGVIFYYIWQQMARGGIVFVGNVAAVFQYLQLISNNYMGIAVSYHQIMQWRADFETAEPIKDDLKIERLTFGQQGDWHLINITDLSFEYESGKQTLQYVGLSFARGSRVALVGESGSGKSSLMAILRGLYEPNHVRLDIDGQILQTLAPLFDMTTLIPQEPEVFENTIGYNITVGIEQVAEDVMQAVRMACFDRVLERLPNGLDTDVRERGVTLSGGERQRLALARGILAARDSSIILMDEPTSSVDAHNEMMIYENIFGHFKNATIISSIHRLHLLNKFDQVIVMDQGKIVQIGTFENLKNQPGLFQKLWDKYWQSAREI